MNQIYAIQNNLVALGILNNLDKSRRWKGQERAAPTIRFELTRKVERAGGRTALDPDTTLAHNLALDKARLLFYDLANHHFFKEDYQVIFHNDNGHPLEKGGYRANLLSATYRCYKDKPGKPERIILDIWDGPGAYDRHLGYAYPLDKEQHALAIILDLPTARQMALAGLSAIQTWEVIRTLQDYGLIPSAPGQATQSATRETEPQQLALSLG